MCVKLPPGDLNSDFYPPHHTNTYTCKMTTIQKMRDDNDKGN